MLVAGGVPIDVTPHQAVSNAALSPAYAAGVRAVAAGDVFMTTDQ